MAYQHKWSPVSCRSSVGQGNFAGPAFYYCATQPTICHWTREGEDGYGFNFTALLDVVENVAGMRGQYCSVADARITWVGGSLLLLVRSSNRRSSGVCVVRHWSPDYRHRVMMLT